MGQGLVQAPSRVSFTAAAGVTSIGARGRAESDRGLHLLEVVDERCGPGRIVCKCA